MKMTRTQRRQMKKLASHVERITDTDRVFFEQHPDRKHRLRLASEEIAQEETLSGKVKSLPPGVRHFTIVRNVVPGVRLRVLVTNAKHGVTDVPEDLMAAMFDEVATLQAREIEADLRAAFSKEGGAA
jgi:hypothetical protein